MRVGAKSLTSVGLLLLSIFLLWVSGRLRVDQVARLDPTVVFVVSLLAVVGARAVHHFWRVAEASEYGLGIFVHLSEEDRRGIRVIKGGTVDIPGALQSAIYVLVFWSVGALTLNNRSVALLADFPRKLSRAGTRYCPEGPSPRSADDPNRPGCELVRRAFRLGYADSLGSCEETTREETGEICKLRHRDEPYLHYAWRLLEAAVSGSDVVAHTRSMASSFREQWAHRETRLRAHGDALLGAPRASHHLFTNLPSPRRVLTERSRAVLQPDRCEDRFADLPHLIDTDDPSLMLEHALAQLLFNSRYRPIVGVCREYVVHWNAPVDACARLTAAPVEFLDAQGALDDVRTVVARRSRMKVVARLAGGPPVDRPIQQVVSFQCFMSGGPAELKKTEIDLDGRRYPVRRLGAPVRTGDRGQIELIERLATLLAPGFVYGRLVSKQSVGVDPALGSEKMLSHARFALTNLDVLGDADVFLGHAWLDERPDLREVYPYHQHVGNFVQLFRSRYRLQRGRL